MGRTVATRAMAITSWHAARRQADVTGAVTLNVASFAGYTLEAAGGDVDLARDLVPVELEQMWNRVRGVLDDIAREEGTSLRAAEEKAS